MTKTASEMAEVLYAYLKADALASTISGGVYHAGLRPRDSKVEDITVAYSAGTTGEVQTSIFYINIYVPDVDPWGNGVLVEDKARTALLERMAGNFADWLGCRDGYLFRLYGQIHTSPVNNEGQHSVVLPLQIDYWTNY